MRVYLDHNAGAPIRPEAREAIARLAASHGNPSSVHRSGQRARRALEEARASVAALIGARSSEVAFTSGGTESNNLAIFAASQLMRDRRRIVTSAIEHSSILAPVAALGATGFQPAILPVDGDGRIAPDVVMRQLDDRAALVTLGLANAEVGTIQTLAPLAERIASVGALFHIDAAQALGRIPVRVDRLGCDLMTLSGHKIGAPAGIGALYVRDSVRIAPLMIGGPQERALRAGTPNVIGAAGFGAATKVVAGAFEEETARIASLADGLLAALRSSIPGIRLNGPISNRIANTLNLTFPDVLGESMLIALDLEGIEVSMGSACAAGAVEPSHVLLAMGRSAAEARSSLRLSLGWNNTVAEIDSAAETIARVWRRVRDAQPASAEAAI